ncbi:MAG: hypothetical protein A4S09_06640 [Proteobacteria bacterium SG_bin7]|nr:MAG: hypothetical protein A4S09_06640 [Proteobacteria bacterium SG_bin7]
MRAIFLIFAFLIVPSLGSAARYCETDVRGGGTCPKEVEEIYTLEIDSDSPFSVFNPFTWFGNNKDAATREVQTGGAIRVNPGFVDDETSAPKRNIPDPSVLKKDKFQKSEDLLKSTRLTESQKKLIRAHSEIIDRVAEADEQARQRLKEINENLNNIDRKLKPLDEQIEGAAKAYNQCVANQQECGSSNAKLLGHLQKIEEIREGRKPIAEKWNSAMRDYNKALDDFRNHTLKMNKELGPYMYSEGALAQQVANLRIALRREEMTREFNDSRFHLIHINDQLDELEDAYDPMRVGTYVQDKIGHLLTSDVLCKVTTKCVNGENNAELNKLELKEIFPNIEANKNSREFYKKRTK